MDYCGKADTAKQKTEEETAKEKVNLAIGSSIEQDGSLNVEDFKVEINRFGGKVIDETETHITVEIDGYEAIVEISSKRIIKFEKKGGILPEVEVGLYQENGNELEEGTSYEKVKIVVNIINEEELGKIDSIIVTNSNGESYQAGADKSVIVAGTGTYTITVTATTDGSQKQTTIKIPIKAAHKYWKIITKEDLGWYNYGDAKVNEPKLAGEMTPIKYVGENQTGNKWANATTADGSMWVWIPRYAYKITSGYHSSTAGTIEIAFLDTKDNFLNGETGEITRNLRDNGAGTTKWLVHPAFTSDATAGGGFGELEGLWVGKFETTGSTAVFNVLPGKKPVRSYEVNKLYQLAKNSKFEEVIELNSHMAKNSEWGAVAYLGHSKYGTNGAKIESHKSYNGQYSMETGGTHVIENIYTTNKKQSTTFNAFGVYDLNSGSVEITASYINDFSGGEAANYCGTKKGDLYGADEAERSTSTAYKTVYPSSRNSYKELDFAGDAIYETSDGSEKRTESAWTSNGSACDNTYMPYWRYPVFGRPGVFGWNAGSNIVGGGTGYWGTGYGTSAVRLVLAIM